LSFLLDLLAAAAGTAVLALLGRALGGWLMGGRDGALTRLTLAVLAGAVALHLLLTGLDFAGLRWSFPAVSLGLAALFVLFRAAGRRAPRPAPTALPSDWGWGDGAALFALLVFALLSVSLWITTPDFVYHWGIKGHRFYLAGGVDYAYLAASWNWVIHPDYPNLVPELYALIAALRGGFREEAVILASPIVFALALGPARDALVRTGTGRFFAQAALALVAVTTAFFSLANLMAGGADGFITLAFLAALPALLRRPDPQGDLAVGIAGAFAAASKVEGLPLAGFLALAQLLRRPEPENGSTGRLGALLPRLLRLAGPTALVALPWLARVHHHHLFLDFNAGALAPGRAAIIVSTLAETLGLSSPWHGFAALLSLLPVLLLPRKTRPIAAVATLQLLFYLYVFFTARVDTVLLIKSSFPRLVMHLLPAVVVAATVAFGEKERYGEESREAS
jgi:hypothetical protein